MWYNIEEIIRAKRGIIKKVESKMPMAESEYLQGLQEEASNNGDNCLLPMDEALKRKGINPVSFRERYKIKDEFLQLLENYYKALHRFKIHKEEDALDLFSDEDLEEIRKIGPRARDALTVGARERVIKSELD